LNLTKYSYCAIIAIDQRKFTVLMKFIQLKQHPEQRLSYHAPKKEPRTSAGDFFLGEVIYNRIYSIFI